MCEEYLVGVDVGTGSARAALVTRQGVIKQVSVALIKTWNPETDHYEQSSDDIWAACCLVVKNVTQAIDANQVKGIGFDATCSLVAIGQDDRPITVSNTGSREQNIILWLDHRAGKQTATINKLQHGVLKYVGGKISLEMETPKLLWLKENLPEVFGQVKYFFDLPDFLTWKATGDDSRSLCSTVCKWTYVAGTKEEDGWSRSYFTSIGLEELLNNEAKIIGSKVNSPGDKCGSGLTPQAAHELGLVPGTAVGSSIIDAHAGGLGLLGCSAPNVSADLDTRLALICGTSTCHMVVNTNPILVPGIWGPYYSAMIPEMWLNEAGQSATGKLLDHVIDTHPAAGEIKKKLTGDQRLPLYLNELLLEMAKKKGLRSVSELTGRYHVWPDYHGNRSPLADPNLLGMVSGLTLSHGEEDLAVKYLATIQALAYGTKHILDALANSGHKKLSSVLICGGLGKNSLFVQTHADVLGLHVLLPGEPESVLLGAAMLGAVAGQVYGDVYQAVVNMGGTADVVKPNFEDVPYHNKKYKVFLKMVEDQRNYDKLML